MSRTPFLIALSLCLALLPAARAADPPTPGQIAEWVKGLASDSFEEREAATKALWKAGRAAEPSLRLVLKDGDAEAARRAREVLDKFDWGLYPDTPPAVVALIGEYRAGSAEGRAAVVPKLLDQGSHGFAALMKLAAAEADPQAKSVLWHLLGQDMPRLAAALLADGQGDRLEDVLEQALAGEGDLPHANYAAYLMVRGKVDGKLRELEKKAGAAPDKKTALTLAYLCRARGDLVGARKYAERAGHALLLRTLLVEQEDWRGLLKQLDAAPADEQSGLQGLRLACLRLAGDRDEFEAAARQLADQVPMTYALTALVLNGKIDDAVTALTKNNQYEAAAELLGARLRFREALDLAGKKADKDSDPPGLVRLFRAGLLVRLGERKKAREVFDAVAREAEANGAQKFAPAEALLVAEYNAGFKDEAFARAADQLKRIDNLLTSANLKAALDLLFQPADVEGGVMPWWKFLGRKYPQDDAAATLKRLRDLFGHKMSSRDEAALLKDMADEAAKLPAEERESWLHCAAETCRALGRDELLEGYLEKWAAAGADARPWLRLGDLSAGRQRWKEAAGRYKRAWEKDRAAALSLYLYGRALARAGQEKEGRRWTEAAEALPLGNEDRRVALAEGLAERGLDDAAGREWERLGRLILPSSANSLYLRQTLADKAAAERDYFRAAACQRRLALDYLYLNADGGAEGMVSLVVAEHRCRARGLAAAGRLDEMRQEVRAALDVEPGSIELALDVVPELTRRGHKKEADELFARVAAVHETLCKEYPASAWCHNNLAWLAARCRRDLDAALEHARKGVELAPDDAGHLDTLAEVHFQRGDKDRAVELMRKCVALQPKSDYFRNQLKRMQAGDRDADLPPEPATGRP